jgi:hypothetical protein
MSCVPNTLINEFLKHSNLKFQRKGYRIKDILIDYWDDFIEAHPHLNIRDVVFSNVQRTIKCQTPALGYAFYECPKCSNFHITFHTCKSRFCNTCGVKYAKARSLAVSQTLLDCKHRHITFTIPDSLRHYFREDRKRLNYLFKAVNQTLKYLLMKHGKYKDYQAGFICVLHTFGRALTFNVHIHAIVSEGMIDKLGHFKPLRYFNFELLRKSFMKCLLDLLHKDLGNQFYSEKSKLYQTKKNGFYVHAPDSSKRFKKHEDLVDYVLRYTGRPAMAQSRILEIDYKTNFVRYYYEPHEDDHLPECERKGPIEVYEHVFDFIKKLIIHIPDHQFKTIRYYGLYSSKGRRRMPNYQRKVTFLRNQSSLKWRSLVLKTFKYDILKCRCGAIMNYSREESYFP